EEMLFKYIKSRTFPIIDMRNYQTIRIYHQDALGLGNHHTLCFRRPVATRAYLYAGVDAYRAGDLFFIYREPRPSSQPQLPLPPAQPYSEQAVALLHPLELRGNLILNHSHLDSISDSIPR
ncbi:MAG: hypothetical protein AAGI88_21570, partial [Pseudomonadota bacterium]